jgi:glycosyltransferase involved in cell wall biosynthesis
MDPLRLEVWQLVYMNDLVRTLNSVRSEFGWNDWTLAIPAPLGGAGIADLLRRESGLSVVVQPQDVPDASPLSDRIGVFLPELWTWRLPKQCPRHLVFLGEGRHVGVRMTREALRHGIDLLVLPRLRAQSVRYSRLLGVCRYLGARMADAATDRTPIDNAILQGAGGRSWWHARSLRAHLGLAALDSIRNRLPSVTMPALSLSDTGLLIRLLRRLVEPRFNASFQQLRSETCHTILPRTAFVRERVVLAVAMLGSGGAERQVVNTALGLKRRGGSSDTRVLCEQLHTAGSDFFLAELQGAGVPVGVVDELAGELPDGACRSTLQRLDPILQLLPDYIADGLLKYIAAFHALRPEVVHAWLDETNIKAGIAAVLVGVPKVVLSTRSVAPNHFALYQPYMRGGYRLLANHPRVWLLNNSHAGAADYRRWLGIDHAVIGVVHNGLLMDETHRPTDAELREWTAEVGIPQGCPVVGTVFRFSEEKQPLLWVRTAALVSRTRPDAWFLMVGDGPLLGDARALAARLGIGERLITPGRVRRPALPIAAMDVFMLTSRMEGLPNVLLEAQALGVPVVTTSVGGAPETLEDGVTGWAVKSRSPRQLARRVEAVLDDARWRARARERAPAFVQQSYGLERMLDETASVYRNDDRA